ncbi:putative late blight resistance protein homolog R1B-23 [Solanum tuberosum]|uniref:putative late blight resistance protein homolog R1B-23 n=1 Tax=Solanum tuberosum TaxID=4113 RepID=UPI00073A2E92|nr:PREDICTED: putative late blight resistance protein homolog R1B-23 [Solanum tuberosum]
MSWERIQQLSDMLNFPKTSIDSVMLFTLERKFCDIFISLQSFTDEPNMLDVTRKIQTLFQDAVFDLSPLYLTEYFDLYASEVQSKILLTKREIRAKYSFPKISLQLPAKFVKDIIPSVLENIGGLVKIHDPYSPLYIPETVLEHIEDVSKELKLLLNFVCFAAEKFIEPQSQHHVNFLTHVLAVSGHISTLIWMYLPDLAPEQMNVMLSDFLRMRIKPIQPCICKIYVDVLLSLKSTIQSGWCTNIGSEDVIDSEGSLGNPSKDAQPFESQVLDLSPRGVNITQVLDLLSNIQRLSIDIYLTIRKAFQSNLPRIHGLGYVDCLLNNLKKFQILQSDSLASVMDKLQLLQKEFENLQPFLQVVAEERNNDLDEIQRCATQLIGKAHEVEYIVDACISKKAPELPSCW